jgi:Protein of unknown function (DUF998)
VAGAGIPGRLVAWWAIVSAGLAPALLIGGWFVAGALQPASYSPVRQTLSVLASDAGTDRWIMPTASLLVGGCHLVTAAGLRCVRIRARVLLAVAGLASIGIAACPEPARGSSPHLSRPYHVAARRTLALQHAAPPAIPPEPASPTACLATGPDGGEVKRSPSPCRGPGTRQPPHRHWACEWYGLTDAKSWRGQRAAWQADPELRSP